MLAIIFLTLTPVTTNCIATGDQDRWKAAITESFEMVQAGQYHQAEAVLLRSLKDATGCGEQSRQMAVTLNSLGSVYQHLDRLDESESHYKRALQVWEETGGELIGRARILNNLAGLYLATQRLSKAEALPLRSIAAQMEGDDQVRVELVRTYTVLADVEFRNGRYHAAEALCGRVYEILQTTYGPEHSESAMALHNLGVVAAANRRPEAALDYMKRALAIAEKTFGTATPAAALIMASMATIYRDTGRLAEAARTFETALRTAEVCYGPQHSLVGETACRYAATLRRVGRKSEAKTVEQRCRTIIGRYLRVNSLDQIIDWRAMGHHSP
jgi:tetratricopeptide (TPR) repeat protein